MGEANKQNYKLPDGYEVVQLEAMSAAEKTKAMTEIHALLHNVYAILKFPVISDQKLSVFTCEYHNTSRDHYNADPLPECWPFAKKGEGKYGNKHQTEFIYWCHF